MFEKIKKGLVRLDCWLRNTTPSEECRLVPFESLFEECHDPARTRAYWFARRWSKRAWDAPSDAYYSAKYAWQRLTRGWDDRAAWSIDWWLDDKMPAMLRKLKEDKHGIPGTMFEGLPTENDDGYTHSDETFKIAEDRWDAALDKIVAAFEASRRIQEGLYEDELGEYPLDRPRTPEAEARADARMAASSKLEERDQKIFEEGMALFAEHYHSLWD
jgi:hypothetical protein